jgi:ABC-type uncharacterized transport system permease subunit
MWLSLKAIALTGAVLGSVYPGFHAATGTGSVAIGTIDGLVDGGVGGLLFAWLYNRLAGTPSHA